MEASKDAPPLFVAAASDDQLYIVPGILAFIRKGGHGFGMNVQHLNSDTRIDRFENWMNGEGLLKKIKFYAKGRF
ncbi:MAG: hypothetical protein WDO19_03640 [Bacteroidota bacterium]